MSIDTEQVIFSLERAKANLETLANKLQAAQDYNAEFPANDAERVGEAIQLIRQRDQLLAAAIKVRDDLNKTAEDYTVRICASAWGNLNDAIAEAQGGAQ